MTRQPLERGVAVVTGAGREVGWAIALCIAVAGARAVVDALGAGADGEAGRVPRGRGRRRDARGGGAAASGESVASIPHGESRTREQLRGRTPRA